jgi:hypothetical protein
MLSLALDVSDSEVVHVLRKGTATRGKVLKRAGTRVRVEFEADGSTSWVESKDLLTAEAAQAQEAWLAEETSKSTPATRSHRDFVGLLGVNPKSSQSAPCKASGNSSDVSSAPEVLVTNGAATPVPEAAAAAALCTAPATDAPSAAETTVAPAAVLAAEASVTAPILEAPPLPVAEVLYESPLPPLGIAPQDSSVANVMANRDLAQHIIRFLPLSDVAVALQLNRGFRDLVRQRVAQSWPKLSPLLEHPFNFTRWHLLWIECLDLSDRLLGDVVLSTLSEACANGAMAQLQKLDVSYNNISDAGLMVLADECAKRTSLLQLEVLNLSGNQIGDVALSSLADACANGALPVLELLHLRKNIIGDAGLSALARAITPTENGKGALPALGRLDVSKNKVGDAGLTSLADALAKGAVPRCSKVLVDLNPGSRELQKAIFLSRWTGPSGPH